MKHYIYLSPVYEHSFFVKSSQSDIKWNERRVNGFPVIWSEIMADNWGNEQWNYRVNLSQGNGWILIEFLRFVIFEICIIKIEGKMLFLSSMLSTQLDNLFSFFPFYKINHLLFLRYYFESISRKVLEQIKKNFQFSKFECKHTYTRNVENYVETWEKSSIRCNEFNWFNKFIIKSWDTRA